MQVKQFTKKGSETVVSIVGTDAYLEQTLVKQGYEMAIVETEDCSSEDKPKRKSKSPAKKKNMEDEVKKEEVAAESEAASEEAKSEEAEGEKAAE